MHGNSYSPRSIRSLQRFVKFILYSYIIYILQEHLMIGIHNYSVVHHAESKKKKLRIAGYLYYKLIVIIFLKKFRNTYESCWFFLSFLQFGKYPIVCATLVSTHSQELELIACPIPIIQFLYSNSYNPIPIFL